MAVYKIRALFAIDSESSLSAARSLRQRVASLLQQWAPRVDGSVQNQTGFGAWGVEEGLVVETSTRHGLEFLEAIRKLLATFEQTCAYVEIDGRAYELSRNAATFRQALKPIEGFRGEY